MKGITKTEKNRKINAILWKINLLCRTSCEWIKIFSCLNI